MRFNRLLVSHPVKFGFFAISLLATNWNEEGRSYVSYLYSPFPPFILNLLSSLNCFLANESPRKNGLH
jgi:hypothetical protein